MSITACIDSGELNKRAFLQVKSTARHAQSGEVTNTWTNVRGIWCGIESKTASESSEQNQMRHFENVDIVCRYAADITNIKRLLIPYNCSALSSGINDSVTSITVDDDSIAPGDRDVILRVGDEFMTVTSGFDTTSLTVTRGAFGSTATTHSSGASVIRYRVANIDGVKNVQYKNVKLLLNCIIENNT